MVAMVTEQDMIDMILNDDTTFNQFTGNNPNLLAELNTLLNEQSQEPSQSARWKELQQQIKNLMQTRGKAWDGLPPGAGFSPER